MSQGQRGSRLAQALPLKQLFLRQTHLAINNTSAHFIAAVQ